MMCDGSSFSNGNRKPVALVRIVNSRNIAVSPGIRLEPSRPNMTMMPETMRDQTDDHVHRGEHRQTHTQDHDTLPFLNQLECYDPRSEISIHASAQS